jgi:hypothetical protein
MNTRTETKILFGTIVACVLVASSALAGPPVESHILASAKWVMHFDVEAFTASRIAKGAMELITAKDSPLPQNKVQKAVKTWEKLADVKSLTFYGCTYDKTDAVLVAKLDYEKAEVMKLLGIRAHDGHKIYTTGGKGRHRGLKRFVCLYDGTTIVASQSEDRLEEALDLLDGRGKPLRANKPLGKMLSCGEGTFMVAAVQDVRKMVAALEDKKGQKKVRRHAALLKKCEGLRLEFGEADDKIFANLNATLSSKEDAMNIQRFAQGMLALGMLHQQDDKRLAKLLRGIKTEQQDDEFSVQIHFPVEDILTKVRDKLERCAAAKTKKQAAE